MGDGQDRVSGHGNRLAPYVPTIAAEWDLDAAGSAWREIDASLCFVDISGFTALSERLAERGRIGAEELTDVLSRVFSSMILLAHERGGGLVKFGGDALLLLFTGPDHVLQACSAAVEMRSALKRSSRIPTSVGRVKLAMSVGVHTGPTQFYCVGGTHRELIVAGPTASRTIEMEGIAGAGEIVVSPEIRSTLGAGTPISPAGSGFRLDWRKPRVHPCGPRPRREIPAASVARWVPGVLRRHLVEAVPEPEHRIGVVAFLKFAGVDSLYRRDGPDAVVAALEELVGTVQRCCDEEGVTFLGSDIDSDGGKIILVAGVPVSHSGDEVRVLRAVRSIVESEPPLDVKIGVNRGHVFAGEVGAPFRSTYTVMGDTVNLAARLAAAAPAGRILATAEVLDPSPIAFSTQAIEPFHVKGKTAPVRAFDVGPSSGPRRHHGDELPFVGRSSELAVLAGAVARCENGSGGAVVLVGETGSGKSRLVREALSTCELPTMAIRGEPYGATTPYRAMRDPSRALLGLRPGTVVEMTSELTRVVRASAPHLLPMLPLVAAVLQLPFEPTPETRSLDPRFVTDRTAGVVIELATRLGPRPAVVVVEDAQWLDDASAHLVARLSGAAADNGWLLVVTRRDQPDAALWRHAETLDLGPFTDAEARQLIESATSSRPLRAGDVESLIRRCSGNPLYLDESLAAIRRTGDLDELPESLDAIVAGQIDSLAPLPRRVLRLASVLGASAGKATLSELLAAERIEADAATWSDLQRFLISDGPDRLRFKHAVVRDAAYGGMAYRRRRDLHRRAAEIITRANVDDPEQVADLLSLHHFRGGDHPAAWKHARIAADRARRAGASVAAGSQLVTALSAARRLPDLDDAELSSTWSDLGDVRITSGNFESALDAYGRASELCGADDRRRAGLMLKRARALERAGRFSSALRATAKVRSLLLDDDTAEADRLRARALSFRAVIRCAQQKPRETLATARDAVTAAEASDEPEALAQALTMIDWAHRLLGRPTEMSHAARALIIYERLGDHYGQAMVHGNLAFECYYTGDWSEAVAHIRLAETALDRTGDTVQAAMAQASIGEIRVCQGRIDEAVPLLAGAGREMRLMGFYDGANFADLNLARARMLEGRIDAAIELLDRVRDTAVDLKLSGSALEAATYRAECDLLLGDVDTALRRLTEAKISAGDDLGVAVATIARVDALALAAAGEGDLARDRLLQGIAEARRLELVYELAMLLGAWDMVDPDGDHTAELAEANEIGSRLGIVPLARLAPA